MDTHDANSRTVAASEDAECTSAGTPTFDLNKYRPQVRNRFVSDEDADAFLSAVGQLVIMIVDMRMSEKDSTAVLSFLNEFPSKEGEVGIECECNPEQNTHDRAAPQSAEEDKQ